MGDMAMRLRTVTLLSVYGENKSGMTLGLGEMNGYSSACQITGDANVKAATASRSILAAHKNARAAGANLFAVNTALGYGEHLPGPVGCGILAANDREGSIEHQTANREIMAM